MKENGGSHQVSHSNTNMSAPVPMKKEKTTLTMKSKKKTSMKNGPDMQKRVTRRPE